MSTTVRIKTPGELAGTIPYLLGFTPDEGSLVYLTIGKGPLARIDMSDRVADVLEVLTPMWDQYPPERACLVFYTANPDQALLHAVGIAAEVERRGGTLSALVRVHDGVCEFMNDGTQHAVDEAPQAAAPFVAQGKAPLGSRDAMVQRLSTDEDRVPDATFEAALEDLKTRGKEGLHQAAEDLIGAMHQHRYDATVPTDKDIATYSLALQAKPVRDLAWNELRREHAAVDVEFFLHLYRRCARDVTAPIAGLLAFAAWLDGGLAPLVWAGIDKALEVEPDYTLAILVQHAMRGAMNPAHWQPLDDEGIQQTWKALR